MSHPVLACATHDVGRRVDLAVVERRELAEELFELLWVHSGGQVPVVVPVQKLVDRQARAVHELCEPVMVFAENAPRGLHLDRADFSNV